MYNDDLVKVFEKMANNLEFINSLSNSALFIRGGSEVLNIPDEGSKYLRGATVFNKDEIGKTLAKIVSAFKDEEYVYCKSEDGIAYIIKNGMIPPENIYNSNDYYIVLAIGRTDFVAFYTLVKEYYASYCGNMLEYPSYLKDFIDDVIRFRLRNGIMAIADYSLDILATQFIKSRSEQLEQSRGEARVRNKKSSQE